MSYLHEPAKSYYNEQSDSVDKNLVLVIVQDGLLVTIYNNGYLSEGLVIEFKTYSSVLVHGVVKSISANNALVEINEYAVVRLGTVVRLYQPAVVTSRLNPEFNKKHIGLLEVVCKTPATHAPGLLGWSFYFSESENLSNLVLVASGNDYPNKSKCVLTESGQWQEGFYKLAATRYDKTLTSIQTKNCSWAVDKVTSLLSAGRYNDSKRGLVFN